jgi:hypothetical protein
MKLKVFGAFMLLAPFLLISFFNHPSLDDFWNANTIAEHGRFGGFLFSIHHFSGRFTSLFLMSLLNTLPRYSIWIFQLFPVVVCAGLFFSCHYFLKTLFSKLKPLQAVLASLLFLIVHILNMRVLYEGLYWMSASVTYQLCIILYLLLLATVYSYYQKPGRIKFITVVLLSALIVGTYEFVIPFVLISFFSLYYYQKQKNKTWNHTIIYAAGIVIIATALLAFFMSGNKARMNIVSNAAFLDVLWVAIKSFVYYSFIWLVQPFNIFLLVLSLVFINSKQYFFNSTFLKKHSYSKFFIATFGLYFIVVLCLYIPQLMLGYLRPYPRVTSLVFLVFLCFLCLNICKFYFEFEVVQRFAENISRLKNLKTGLWIGLFISGFCSANFMHVTKDLMNGTAYHFSIEENQRYIDLNNCKTDTCYIEPHKNWPISLQQTQTERDLNKPTLYLNKYFNKKAVLIKW